MNLNLRLCFTFHVSIVIHLCSGWTSKSAFIGRVYHHGRHLTTHHGNNDDKSVPLSTTRRRRTRQSPLDGGALVAAVAATAATTTFTNENEQPTEKAKTAIKGITLKIAVDSQGGVADLAASHSDRFTSAASLDRVHRLRRDAQAILIGRGTVLFDNPSLTIRRNVTLPPGQSPPLRVVLDSRLSLLIERVQHGRMYQLLEDGLPTLVYHAMQDIDEESLNLFESIHLVKVTTDSSTKKNTTNPRLNVSAVWEDLQKNWSVSHLMVEGGSATARSFLKAGLVDRVILVKAKGITFRKPVPSGIAAETLRAAHLECIGSFEEEGDTTECWVRPGESWPAENLTDWP